MWPLVALGAIGLAVGGYVLKKPEDAVKEEDRIEQLAKDYKDGRLDTQQYLNALNAVPMAQQSAAGPNLTQVAVVATLLLGGMYVITHYKEL